MLNSSPLRGLLYHDLWRFAPLRLISAALLFLFPPFGSGPTTAGTTELVGAQGSGTRRTRPGLCVRGRREDGQHWDGDGLSQSHALWSCRRGHRHLLSFSVKVIKKDEHLKPTTAFQSFSCRPDSDLLITHHVSCEFNRFSSEGAGQLLLKW